MQDAFEKNKKHIFPHWEQLNAAIWVSGSLQQFLPHVHNTILVCKQMGLDANFADAEKVLETTNLDMDVAKMEYTQLHSFKKPQSKGEKEMGANPNPH